ncbi:AraC family transcriptional regulator [Rubrivivax gelatinosus]|uniref:AraC-like DNA-binding protein n=1 Tax=Rubrivivax gelatinosus TaxID=28068 RepID=A0A4R2MW00_RUBGE|nr:helix-turn-helix transcriptional regulator [Rubrivivax gelatinosus]MBK1685943.1 AraC family transcriptional regulator [Rubrivivax gelatinosus]TCP04033.1 AraC-like DNA-binding protein [Rubrivivax gelatinosus]
MPRPARPRASRSELPLDPAVHAPSAAHPVWVRKRRLSAATRIVPHRHPWAQVAFSATGVVRLTVPDHTFIVPPTRVVWVPPDVEHFVSVVEDAELVTMYVLQDELSGPRPLAGTAAGDWGRCRVLEASPLLRELVAQLADEAVVQEPAREQCLAALLQDELARARPLPLGVRLPADKRLRALCEAVIEDPARHDGLDGWAQEAGASVRTVARLFRQELDTSFAAWRQQVLLAKALSMAAARRPMAHIAAELGYASPSAFSAMVRRAVGMPPSRFFNAG